MCPCTLRHAGRGTSGDANPVNPGRAHRCAFPLVTPTRVTRPSAPTPSRSEPQPPAAATPRPITPTKLAQGTMAARGHQAKRAGERHLRGLGNSTQRPRPALPTPAAQTRPAGDGHAGSPATRPARSTQRGNRRWVRRGAGPGRPETPLPHQTKPPTCGQRATPQHLRRTTDRPCSSPHLRTLRQQHATQQRTQRRSDLAPGVVALHDRPSSPCSRCSRLTLPHDRLSLRPQLPRTTDPLYSRSQRPRPPATTPPHATVKRAHAVTAHSQTKTVTGHSAQAQPRASQTRELTARPRVRRHPALPAKLPRTGSTVEPHPRENATLAEPSRALPVHGAAHAASIRAPPARSTHRGSLQQIRHASVTRPRMTHDPPRERRPLLPRPTP